MSDDSDYMDGQCPNCGVGIGWKMSWGPMECGECGWQETWKPWYDDEYTGSAVVDGGVRGMTEKTIRCPICGRPYKFYAHFAGDQSACPKCRTEAQKQEGVWQRG